MPKNPDATLTTAYASNTRSGSKLQKRVNYDRNDKIRRLLEADHSFLPICYRSPGFLFRGLEIGLSAACENGHFSLNRGDHTLAHLERDLGVLLVSADFSDAYTVSRLWKSADDGVILALKGDYFAEAYARHKAATLAFAEPGVLFKYPFLCDPIDIRDVAYFIVKRTGAEILNQALKAGGENTASNSSPKLILADSVDGRMSRQALSQYLEACLDERKIISASMLKVDDYPQR